MNEEIVEVDCEKAPLPQSSLFWKLARTEIFGGAVGPLSLLGMIFSELFGLVIGLMLILVTYYLSLGVSLIGFCIFICPNRYVRAFGLGIIAIGLLTASIWN